MAQQKKDLLVATSDQREALSSPIRLEILGQFINPGGMSIPDIARRIGRPAGALYYHFRILERVGILRRVGSRPGVKRSEALFEPVAHRIALPTGPDKKSSIRTALKTVSAAFRMAERDMEAALASGTGRKTGKHRNFLVARVHGRLTRATLAEISKHLQAMEKIFNRENRRKKLPPDADQYCSLTIALLPLRGRAKR